MSVYRFNPPSVGFAALAAPAFALAELDVPTATIGASTVSPTGSVSSAEGRGGPLISTVATVIALGVALLG